MALGRPFLIFNLQKVDGPNNQGKEEMCLVWEQNITWFVRYWLGQTDGSSEAKTDCVQNIYPHKQSEYISP